MYELFKFRKHRTQQRISNVHGVDYENVSCFILSLKKTTIVVVVSHFQETYLGCLESFLREWNRIYSS